MRALAILLLTTACGGTTDVDCANAPTEIPSSSGAMFTYLACNGYQGFAAKESSVHASNTAHGSRVRVFINTALDQSLSASAAVHPMGAASVKELYESDGTTLRGWAAMVKVEDGNDGSNWYWYENASTDSNSPIEGKGNRTCTGCHFEGGRDYFRTTYPLQ